MDDKEALEEVERRLAKRGVTTAVLTPEELQDAINGARIELDAKRNGTWIPENFWSAPKRFPAHRRT